jgi:hypothetical protein
MSKGISALQRELLVELNSRDANGAPINWLVDHMTGAIPDSIDLSPAKAGQIRRTIKRALRSLEVRGLSVRLGNSTGVRPSFQLDIGSRRGTSIWAITPAGREMVRARRSLEQLELAGQQNIAISLLPELEAEGNLRSDVSESSNTVVSEIISNRSVALAPRA